MENHPGSGAWYWLAGLAGAVVSLAHMQALSVWQKIIAVLVGTLTAGFCGPWIAEYIGASPRATAALHFVIGLGGLILTAGIVRLLRAARDNPAGTLGEILKRIAPPKGG